MKSRSDDERHLHITIPTTLVGLNDYVKGNRAGWQVGNRTKKEQMRICALSMVKYRRTQLTNCTIVFSWYEKNRRRDKDNVAFAKKFILDAMQEVGILQNDGWDDVAGFTDRFYVDAKNPRVEVDITGRVNR